MGASPRGKQNLKSRRARIQFKKKSTYKRDTDTVHNRSTEVWERRILVPRRTLEGEDRQDHTQG